MSHRKTDLGIPRRSKSAKVVLGHLRVSRIAAELALASYRLAQGRALATHDTRPLSAGSL